MNKEEKERLKQVLEEVKNSEIDIQVDKAINNDKTTFQIGSIPLIKFQE